MGGFKWPFAMAVTFFVVLVTIMALLAPDEPGRAPSAGSTGVSGYSHEILQADAVMTQQMSAPSAGPMHRGPTNPMLERSRNPGYLRALEQHQAAIDRMLARPGPQVPSWGDGR